MFASGDTLFQRAVDKFHLRGHRHRKRWRHKAEYPESRQSKDTKILQISVTLSDRDKAQADGQFLAAETVS